MSLRGPKKYFGVAYYTKILPLAPHPGVESW